jgi:hypothetical protein
MLANDTEYGLAAYFYTRDLRRAWHIAEQLEYGMVSVRRSSGSGTLHKGVAAVHTTAHVLCLSTATHNVSLHLAAEGVGGGGEDVHTGASVPFTTPCPGMGNSAYQSGGSSSSHDLDTPADEQPHSEAFP